MARGQGTVTGGGRELSAGLVSEVRVLRLEGSKAQWQPGTLIASVNTLSSEPAVLERPVVPGGAAIEAQTVRPRLVPTWRARKLIERAMTDEDFYGAATDLIARVSTPPFGRKLQTRELSFESELERPCSTGKAAP